MSDLKTTVHVDVEFFDGQECLALCLEDGDSVAEYGLVLNARVQPVIELPRPHVQTE